MGLVITLSSWASLGLVAPRSVRNIWNVKPSTMPVPDDWCYVNNFANERQPKAIRLPAGKGAGFRQAISELITRFASDIPRTFESDEFISGA